MYQRCMVGYAAEEKASINAAIVSFINAIPSFVAILKTHRVQELHRHLAADPKGHLRIEPERPMPPIPKALRAAAL